MRKIIIITIAALLSMASCVDPNDITIKGVGSFKGDDLSEMEIGLIVENNSRKEFIIKDIDIDIVDNKDLTHPIVNIKSKREVVINKKTTEQVMIPFRMQIMDLGKIFAFGLSSFAGSLSAGNSSQAEFRAVGYFHIKGGGFNGKHKIDYPIDQGTIERMMRD